MSDPENTLTAASQASGVSLRSRSEHAQVLQYDTFEHGEAFFYTASSGSDIWIEKIGDDTDSDQGIPEYDGMGVIKDSKYGTIILYGRVPG